MEIINDSQITTHKHHSDPGQESNSHQINTGSAPRKRARVTFENQIFIRQTKTIFVPGKPTTTTMEIALKASKI